MTKPERMTEAWPLWAVEVITAPERLNCGPSDHREEGQGAREEPG